MTIIDVRPTPQWSLPTTKPLARRQAPCLTRATPVSPAVDKRAPADINHETASTTLPLDRLESVSLAELVEHAALMQRTDRKYFAAMSVVDDLISGLSGTHRVLEISGRQSTDYRTLYFDTEGFDACRAHVQKRRRRWKARSRLYVEDGLCRIEVKTKDRRGETLKVMGPSDPSRYGQLAGSELDFVAAHLAADHPEVNVAGLVPAAEISYTRATLADLTNGTRVTIDWNLHCRLGTGEVWLDPSYALIETKGPQAPSLADHTLNRLGTRPQSFSKYTAAASMMSDTIADNDVRFLQGSVLHHCFTS